MFGGYHFIWFGFALVWFALVGLCFPWLDGYPSNFKSDFDDVKSKVDVVNLLVKTNLFEHGLVWVLGFEGLFQTFQVRVCCCKKQSLSNK